MVWPMPRRFGMVSGVLLVDCHPECSLSLSYVYFPLKHLYHIKVLLWLMASSWKAFCSMQWVSPAVFSSLKQNLMQTVCWLKSIIHWLKRNHWNITSQNHNEQNNKASSVLVNTFHPVCAHSSFPELLGSTL